MTEVNSHVVTSDSIHQESTYLTNSDAELLTEHDETEEKVD